MKRILILTILLMSSLAWAGSTTVVVGQGGGPAPGTVLLGLDNSDDWPTFSISSDNPTDSDSDGMWDTTETAVFGDLTKDGTADSDGDGYYDFEEYLFYLGGYQESESPSTPSITGTFILSPSIQTINIGSTQQYTCTDAEENDITSSVTWTSSHESTATISSGGIATGVSSGSAIIRADYDGEFGKATLFVKRENPGLRFWLWFSNREATS